VDIVRAEEVLAAEEFYRIAGQRHLPAGRQHPDGGGIASAAYHALRRQGPKLAR
jgi:hypothetical protein